MVKVQKFLYDTATVLRPYARYPTSNVLIPTFTPSSLTRICYSYNIIADIKCEVNHKYQANISNISVICPQRLVATESECEASMGQDR
jgi:hypothetical protein